MCLRITGTKSTKEEIPKETKFKIESKEHGPTFIEYLVNGIKVAQLRIETIGVRGAGRLISKYKKAKIPISNQNLCLSFKTSVPIILP